MTTENQAPEGALRAALEDAAAALEDAGKRVAAQEARAALAAQPQAETWTGATAFIQHAQNVAGAPGHWPDEFLAWYKPADWAGEHRAAAVWLGQKMGLQNDAAETLRGQLADLQALCDERGRKLYGGDGPAPAEAHGDERAAFETWAGVRVLKLTRSDVHPGEYASATTQEAWDAWQERADLPGACVTDSRINELAQEHGLTAEGYWSEDAIAFGRDLLRTASLSATQPKGTAAAAFDDLRHQALRALIAWDGTTLPKAHDGLMQERMECLRAALEAAQPQPKGTEAEDLAELNRTLLAECDRLRSNLKSVWAKAEAAAERRGLRLVLQMPQEHVEFVDAVQAPAPAPDDKALTQALEERDAASDYIDALLDEVLGKDRHEWTSNYGHADAMDEVRERMAALQFPAPAPLTEEQIVHDGLMMCPTKLLDNCADAFEAGVKFAELAHGITGKSQATVRGSRS